MLAAHCIAGARRTLDCQEHIMRLAARLTATINNTLRGVGFEVRRYAAPVVVQGDVHEPVHPVATYSPWNRDRVFLDVFRKIRAHTLVDKYRCFELWSLVEQSSKVDGALMEVGVWRGGTGALIARRAQLDGGGRVYLCDTFCGVVKASSRDSTYRGGECANTSQRIVERLLDDLGLTNVTVLTGVFPEQTAHLVGDSTFRFCHIDVDVYQSAKDVVDWIWERMSIGGIVVYDDYGFAGCDGITRYVEEQTNERDRIVVHNLNGHAVVVKIG